MILVARSNYINNIDGAIDMIHCNKTYMFGYVGALGDLL